MQNFHEKFLTVVVLIIAVTLLLLTYLVAKPALVANPNTQVLDNVIKVVNAQAVKIKTLEDAVYNDDKTKKR